MRVAYFDAQGGVSGDMFLGALADAGCPLSTIEETLSGLPISPFRLSKRTVERGGTRCTKVDVEIDASGGPVCRTLANIEKIVTDGLLPDPVKKMSLRVLTRLLAAESQTRGRAPHEIELTEPEASDLVADVVGTAAGLARIGIHRMHASPLRLGQGAHVVPPAVLALARGWPVLPGGPAKELTTPTGAALVTTLAEPSLHPPLILERTGYGAGLWDGREPGEKIPWPNYFRLWIGEAPPWEQDAVWELATNLDNFNPEGMDLLMERLFAAGALDVFLTPIQMKKSRPGTMLTVLADGAAVEPVERILFAETPTLGVRRTLAQREKLPRRHETIATRYGPVRFKVAALSAESEKAWPEFEDLKRLALAQNLPLPVVQEEAMRAWRERRGENP